MKIVYETVERSNFPRANFLSAGSAGNYLNRTLPELEEGGKESLSLGEAVNGDFGFHLYFLWRDRLTG